MYNTIIIQNSDKTALVLITSTLWKSISPVRRLRKSIWNILKILVIADTIVNVIEELYRDAPKKICFKGKDNNSFNINRGVTKLRFIIPSVYCQPRWDPAADQQIKFLHNPTVPPNTSYMTSTTLKTSASCPTSCKEYSRN